MKVNISLVDLLLFRMTQPVAIALDTSSAAAGVPWRFVFANQAGSSLCSASRAGCSAWISVQPLSAPSALTAAKAAIHTAGPCPQSVSANSPKGASDVAPAAPGSISAIPQQKHKQ